MPGILRFLIFCIMLCFCSISVNASDTAAPAGERPEFIPVVKKPCYIGCDYLLQFCYFYDISNMENAIKVKEWNVDKDYVTGKAVANIKARFLIKMCYQVSLTSAYPVVDQDLDFESEFEFKINLINSDAGDQCIQFQDEAITYNSFELKGDVDTDPIPRMQGQLGKDMAEMIQDSVSKAVYDFLPENIRGKKVYCLEEFNKTYEDNASCPCD